MKRVCPGATDADEQVEQTQTHIYSLGRKQAKKRESMNRIDKPLRADGKRGTGVQAGGRWEWQDIPRV